jgi:DNA-directed RNA polymerase specialized sigma54-like protein
VKLGVRIQFFDPVGVAVDLRECLLVQLENPSSATVWRRGSSTATELSGVEGYEKLAKDLGVTVVKSSTPRT